MQLIADVFLIAGALGAGLYCYVLARRLTRFTDLENGVGGAVKELSMQVSELTRTMDQARSAAGSSTDALEELTTRAENVSRRMELMLASLHDMPEAAARAPESPAPIFARRPAERRVAS